MNNMHKMEMWMDNELRTCKDLHYRLSRKLSRHGGSAADGRLTCSVKKGNKYYAEVWVENGEKKTRYLGREDNQEVLAIKEKHFLKKALSVLGERIQLIESGTEKLRMVDFREINESLPKVYRMTPEQLKDIAGPDAEEKWYRRALREKEIIDKRHGIIYSSGKVHTAKDGTRMRSKSEVSIANELINREIPYIYEMPVKVGNIWMHPDIMFYSFSRMKPMIWEHAGMLGDSKYMEDFARKTDTYIKGGLVPCVDIIFSFDKVNGWIDSRQIDAIIDEYR